MFSNKSIKIKILPLPNKNKDKHFYNLSPNENLKRQSDYLDMLFETLIQLKKRRKMSNMNCEKIDKFKEDISKTLNEIYERFKIDSENLSYRETSSLYGELTMGFSVMIKRINELITDKQNSKE